MAAYMVTAGNWEESDNGFQENCKYDSKLVSTLWEAMVLFKACDDYPWSRIEYLHDGKWYVIDVYAK